MLNFRFCCLFSSTSSAQCSISFHGFIGISFTKSSSRLFSRCYSCSYSTREHGQLLFARPLLRCQRSTQYDKLQCKEASLEKAPHSDVLIHALFPSIIHRPFVVSRRSILLAPRKPSTSVATGLSPSYMTTSRTTRSLLSAMVPKATDRA